MQTINQKFLMAASSILGGPVASAIQGAIEVGVVVPSILRKNLQSSGFAIEEFELKHLKGIRIFSGKSKWPNPTNLNSTVLSADDGKVIGTANEFGDNELVAQGASFDHADALLHAMLGYVRERMVTSTKEEAAEFLAFEAIAGNKEKKIPPMISEHHLELLQRKAAG